MTVSWIPWRFLQTNNFCLLRNTPIRPGIIRFGTRLTETLTGTHVGLKRLFTWDFIQTTSTGSFELRFQNRGYLPSDSIAGDRYHSGPLRREILRLTMATYPGCQRLFMRGSGFGQVSSAFGRTRVAARGRQNEAPRRKREKTSGTQGSGNHASDRNLPTMLPIP